MTGGGVPIWQRSLYIDTSSPKPSSRNDEGCIFSKEGWKHRRTLDETLTKNLRSNKRTFSEKANQYVKWISYQYEVLSFAHQFIWQTEKPLFGDMLFRGNTRTHFVYKQETTKKALIARFLKLARQKIRVSPYSAGTSLILIHKWYLSLPYVHCTPMKNKKWRIKYVLFLKQD